MVPIAEVYIQAALTPLSAAPSPLLLHSANSVMPNCFIIGDSLALGIAAALAAMNSGECEVRARVGASSQMIASFADNSEYDAAIISAGSNDLANRDLMSALGEFRRKVLARRVTWIYPRAAAAAWAVHDIAARFHDRAVRVDLGDLAGWRASTKL